MIHCHGLFPLCCVSMLLVGCGTDSASHAIATSNASTQTPTISSTPARNCAVLPTALPGSPATELTFYTAAGTLNGQPAIAVFSTSPFNCCTSQDRDVYFIENLRVTSPANNTFLCLGVGFTQSGDFGLQLNCDILDLSPPFELLGTLTFGPKRHIHIESNNGEGNALVLDGDPVS